MIWYKPGIQASDYGFPESSFPRKLATTLFRGTKKSLEKDVTRKNGDDVSNDEILLNLIAISSTQELVMTKKERKKH
ncbi:hypothetical protein SADUNF_Sadunf16G0122300 [Salix dunnii]|uniref:Uncharacterized protein n=1 Tax=Salix dunnii TaxID=1413687 RepID=A0A835MGS1_9ROSI|nr:hypothetical protein SADUNF_Sadunf16G0122300 [Salix dunnii]